MAYNSNRDTTGTLRDTSGADCGAWDYHPDEPEDEGEAVSFPEAREIDGETSVAPYRGQTRRDPKPSS